MKLRYGWIGISALVICALALMGVACNRSATSTGSTGGKPSPTLPVDKLSRMDVEPDAAPPKKAKLLLGGVSVPVTTQTEHRDNRFTIELVTHGEVFESEDYVNTTEGFAVASVGITEFDPPIPLLKFPVSVGQDSWTWKGTLSADVEEHSATAQISTSSDSINLGLRPVDTIKVQVDIVFDSIRAGESAERQLIFWFQPKKGLIKRSVGATSAREPVES